MDIGKVAIGDVTLAGKLESGELVLEVRVPAQKEIDMLLDSVIPKLPEMIQPLAGMLKGVIDEQLAK